MVFPAYAEKRGDGEAPSIEKKEKKTKPVKRPLSHPWDEPGHSSGKLHPGKPAAAGMQAAPLEEIDSLIEASIDQGVMPGAVVLVARRGVIVKEQAYGYSAQFADDEKTPLDRPIRMETDTIFDMASVSKLFTSTAVMQLYEKERFDLDDPVAEYLPDFAENGKEKVTIRQLLTHTSGFEPFIPLYQMGASREERLQIVLRHPLVNRSGSKYVYSDLNLITLGALVEKLTGQRLDEYVREHITEPLDMSDTMYNPGERLKKRIAATEYQPWTNRGLVWGDVHDENAWSLDGVAGHAGVFSSARDLAVFAQMMLNGGKYGGKRILSKESIELMTENQIPQFPGDDHGLGWELYQGWYMDALSDSKTMGHTGYTGTSIVVSPNNETICIVLTNRVHPTRNTVSTNPVRRGVARQAALAIPVDIPWKDGAWFAGVGDERQNTLTAEVDLAEGGEIAFDTWFRIENESDYGYVEASVDGENWTEVGPAATGESDWKKVTWELPSGIKQIRFRYATDKTVNGRGWFVHDPEVKDEAGHEVDVEWMSDGWSQEGN
ncbi:serine hydrolase [Brevibacillus choshinensis]|uniref:Serine hydrolase n=1 Tax=Brevibacillus choshinensis TaxID=54911 RepID=A0ABX7FXQ9_BRECH|nr:serine hydrolase [Brevibacillus choshinensis]QRG70581.1 serine hydrolase [Brevibacillus choshinensis]